MIVDQTSLPTHVHPFSGTRRPIIGFGPLLLNVWMVTPLRNVQRSTTESRLISHQRKDHAMSEVRLGIDVACRADHRASLADERGEFIWSSWKFRTTTADLERLWAKIPDGASVTVILEPTRNAWVPLSAWLQARGATVILVPPEQSADLRDYYNKHTKTDRLDSGCWLVCRCCTPRACGASTTSARRSHCAGRSVTASAWSSAAARPVCVSTHSSSCWGRGGPIPSDRPPLRRPPWSSWRNTPIHGRSSVSGAARLAALLIRSSAGLWREDKADELLAMANETLELWSCGGIDFTELAHDIASEVRVLRRLDDEITAADKRIAALYDEADPKGIVASAPGLGPSSRRPSWATRGTSTASPTWPAFAPSRDLCPRSTSPDWWRDTRASPRQVMPACARPCTWRPITLATSTPRSPSATSDWS